MNYQVILSNRFKRDYKLAMRRGLNPALLEHVLRLLQAGEPLPERYRDHALSGKYAGFRELHIQSDWLLVYAIDNGALVLTLMRTGTHSDLF